MYVKGPLGDIVRQAVVILAGWRFDSLNKMKLIHSHTLISKRNTWRFIVVSSSLSGTEPNRSQTVS